MKHLPAIQVMSAKSSVKNRANMTSYSTSKDTIKISVHNSVRDNTQHSMVDTLCMGTFIVPILYDAPSRVTVKLTRDSSLPIRWGPATASSSETQGQIVGGEGKSKRAEK